MPQKNQQKMKMLFLVEMLRECSDEQHPLTTQEIVERIRAHGITCDRRTVSIDMAQLNEYGIEVMSVMLGHKTCSIICPPDGSALSATGTASRSTKLQALRRQPATWCRS